MPLIGKSDINKLIEMIKKTSPMSAFLLQALVCKSYPNRLSWMEGHLGDLAFCLDCPSERKKEWTQEVQNIFMDYTTFTTRSKAKDNGKRTVFMNGLSKSPYIKIDDSKSNDYKKCCNLNKKFEELANSKLEDILLCNAATGRTTENSSISIVTVLEDLMLQSTAIESIPTASIEPPDMTVTLYGSDNECQTIFPEMDLLEYYEQVDAVPMETESSVPNISIIETSHDPLSFYDKVSHNSCNRSIDGNLTNAEPSTSFLASEESTEYPSNYDPSSEFLFSLKNNAPPHKSVESDSDLFMRVNSSPFDILGIHRFKYMGNQVHLLEQVNLDSPVPVYSSDHWMFTVKLTI